MNTDIRLKLDIFEHPKVKKLSRRLGAEAVLSLLRLWLWAAANRPDGVLSAMDAEDVELAADWNGAEGALVAALAELRLLDMQDAGVHGESAHGAAPLYVIHDWRAHQAWASTAEERSRAARRAAQMRWNRDEPAFPEARPVPAQRESVPALTDPAPACDEAALSAHIPAPSREGTAQPAAPCGGAPESAPLPPVIPAASVLPEARPAPSTAPCVLPYQKGKACAAEQDADPAEAAPHAGPSFKEEMPRAAKPVAPRSCVAAPESLRASAAPCGSVPAAPESAPDAPDAPRMQAQCGIMRPASTRIAPLKELKQEYPPIPLTGDTPQEGELAPVPAHPCVPKGAVLPAQPAAPPASNGGVLGARPAAGAPPSKTQKPRPQAAPALAMAAPAAPFPAGHALEAHPASAAELLPAPAPPHDSPHAQPAPAETAPTLVPAPAVPHKGGASASKRQRQRARRAFQPPSVEQVAAYCRSQGFGISPQRFVEYYTAQGWFVGRAPMRDWQAAVRLWEQRDRDQARERLARRAASPGREGPQADGAGVIQRARPSSVHQAQVQERDLMARLILESAKHQPYQEDNAWPSDAPALALPLCGVPVAPRPVLTPELCSPAPRSACPETPATENTHAHSRRYAQPAHAAEPPLPPEWAAGL